MFLSGLRFLFFLIIFLFQNSLLAPPEGAWRGDYSGSGSKSFISAMVPEPKSWSERFFEFFLWNKPVERPFFGPSEPEFLTLIQGEVFDQWSFYGFELPRDNTGRTHSFVTIDARKGLCHLYGSWLNKPQISGKGFRRVGVVSHIKVISGQVTVRSVDSFSKRNPIDRMTPVTLRAGEFRSLGDILSNSNFSQMSAQRAAVKSGWGAPCLCRGIVNFLGAKPLDKTGFLEPCGINCLKYKACPKGHFGRDRNFVNKCRVCDHWFNDVKKDVKIPSVGHNYFFSEQRGAPLKPLAPTKRTQIKHELPKPRMQGQAFMSKPTVPLARAQMNRQGKQNQLTQSRRPSQIGSAQPTTQRVSQPVQKMPVQPQEDIFDLGIRKINSGIDSVIDFFY